MYNFFFFNSSLNSRAGTVNATPKSDAPRSLTTKKKRTYNECIVHFCCFVMFFCGLLALDVDIHMYT